MRIKLFLSVLAFGTNLGLCAPLGDVVGYTAPLTITQNTQIPGETLKPGDYSITVVDSLSDRMIVRVDSRTGNHHALFLAVPTKKADLAGGNGPVLWNEGVNKTQALRGFGFNNGHEIEFVYPKAEAAALAKGNLAKVVAVDPESEGRSRTIKNLSRDELQMVNLWMLSLTTTGLDGKTPAVLAQKYDGPGTRATETVASTAPVRQTEAAPVQVARLETPVLAAPRQEAAPAVRSARRAPVVATLPHTAGYMPLVWVTGLFSLLGAVIARFGRTRIFRRAVA